MRQSWIGYYIGAEFPEYFGKEIEVKDDYSDPTNPCYQIRFVGENIWYDNMDDSDWQIRPVKKQKHENTTNNNI